MQAYSKVYTYLPKFSHYNPHLWTYIYIGQGKAIEKYASRDIKVVVVGNPANTNCLITMKNAPSIPPNNFTAMTRLDQNRAVSQLSAKIGCSVSSINNVIIWGNHSKTGKVLTSVRSAINDDFYVDNTFITTVQQRGICVIFIYEYI